MLSFRPLLAVLALGLSGCDTINYTQYQVAHASHRDCEVIKTGLQRASHEAGLADRTELSKRPNTIAFYAEPVEHFGTSLGGRLVGDTAVVDLSCFHPGVGKPLAFKQAERVLGPYLTEEFGSRLVTPDHDHKIQ